MDPSGIAADATPTGPRYCFGSVVVDERAHTVFREGKPLALEPKTFAVLLALLRHPGELLERDQLLDAVWGHRHVTPGVLTRAVAQLRHALGDDPHRPRFIQTQHTLGYRFIGQLLEQDATSVRTGRRASDGTGPAAPARPMQPESAPPTAGDASPPVPRTQAMGPLPQAAATRAARAATPAGTGRGAVGFPASAATLLVLALALGLAWLGWLGWSSRDQTGMTPAAGLHMEGAAPLAPDPPPTSIAVLPFTSLSADRNDAYFAQGLAEEMRDTLAGVPGLQVAARPAAADGASGPADVKALGVATVLDASVRREGRRIRIHARLFDTDTGYTLWSDSYDREADDVLALQSEIATEVAQALLGVLPAAQPGIAPGDPDGIACNLAPDRGRVYIDVDYGANAMPAANPDQCEVERGSTVTWRGPPGEPAEFTVVFAEDSPEGTRGSRVLASDPAGGREKITMTAGNEAGRYKYVVEAYGGRSDQAILIRNSRWAKTESE